MESKLSKLDWQELLQNFNLECEGCGCDIGYNEEGFEHPEYTGPFCPKCALLLENGDEPKYIRLRRERPKEKLAACY